MQRIRVHFDFGLLAAALLPIIAILPTLNGSFVIETADGPFHVHRIFAATTLLQNGDFYPRWIPWFHLGYGYPVFNYYAPLGTYLGGLLGILGVSAPLAYSLIIAGGWIFGSIGMYLLARRFMPSTCALLASALWAYTPSCFQNVWNVGSISQLTASSIAPWLILSLIIAAKTPGLRPVGFIAFTFGGILLAHQPTAVLVGLMVLPAAVIGCIWYSRDNWHSLVKRITCVAGGLVLGVGIASIFLMPMALELNHIQIAETGGNIPDILAANFLHLSQLFAPITAPDQSQFQASIPDTIGLIGGIFAATGLVALLLRRRYFLALMLGLGALLVVFLLLDISTFVWLNVPYMAQLRFPGRALRLGSIIFALLGGASLWLLPQRWQTHGSIITIALVILVSMPLIYPSRDFLDFSNLNAVDEIRFEAETGAIGGTSYNEFKPIWGSENPYDVPTNVDNYAVNPLQLYVQPVEATIATVHQLNNNEWQISAEQPFAFSLRQFYFPGWSVWIDGEAVTAYPEARYGLLSVDAPAGEHVISVNYTGTATEQIAPFITLMSVIIASIFIVRGKTVKQETQFYNRRAAFIVIGYVVIFAIVNEFFIEPNTDWFRQNSPPDAPIGMEVPVHERFGDAYELLGYTLNQNDAEPGEVVEITLFWKAQQPLASTYEPVIQFIDPLENSAWGAVELPFVGETPRLHTPDYFIAQRIKIPVFDDAPPYIASISVQLRDPESDAWLLTSNGSNRLILSDTIRILDEGQPVLKVFDYVFNQQLELWCASVEREGNNIQIDLFWHVLSTIPDTDLHVFVHGIDDDREIVSQDDGLPLSGEYLPANWLPGQTLHDQFNLADPQARIQYVNIGLYVPGGARFDVKSQLVPVSDDMIRLSITARQCS